jgi:hypothetical protein
MHIFGQSAPPPVKRRVGRLYNVGDTPKGGFA